MLSVHQFLLLIVFVLVCTSHCVHIFNNRGVKSFVVTPEADFSTDVSKQDVNLTPEMIQRYEKNKALALIRFGFDHENL